MRSLLLGAAAGTAAIGAAQAADAAGTAAIGAAQAADLPMTKGEAVEYVKVCSTFGPGFFYIPGSDTCLKIGGEIRADYRVFGRSGDLGDFSRGDDRSAFNTQGRVWFDARTQTDYGLLRSYFQINADSRPINGSPVADAADAKGRGTSNKFSIDKAFIQFGGLTAGYAHSFFGFYDNEYGDTIWAPYYNETSTVNLIAYTAQFGGGFSATVALEDGRDHRDGTAINGIAAPYSYAGGQQVPDLVAQLRYDADWGSLALQGAIHQWRSGESFSVTSTANPPVTTYYHVPTDDKWGYAVGATALFKIPAIDGGHFVVEGQYANGALHYLGIGNTVLGGTDQYYSRSTGTGGNTDPIVLGGLQSGKGWSVTAELGGNISPVLNANLVGSYINTSYDRNAIPDFKIQEYSIAGNLTYTIVKGLSIAGEVAYTHVKLDGIFTAPVAPATNATYKDEKENIWQAGVRLKRVF